MAEQKDKEQQNDEQSSSTEPKPPTSPRLQKTFLEIMNVAIEVTTFKKNKKAADNNINKDDIKEKFKQWIEENNITSAVYR